MNGYVSEVEISRRQFERINCLLNEVDFEDSYRKMEDAIEKRRKSLALAIGI